MTAAKQNFTDTATTTELRCLSVGLARPTLVTVTPSMQRGSTEAPTPIICWSWQGQFFPVNGSLPPDMSGPPLTWHSLGADSFDSVTGLSHAPVAGEQPEPEENGQQK
jgi:hypothetical protein